MLEKLFGGKKPEATEMTEPEKRAVGKIIHVEDEKGWGFISSPEVPFTRIFFHWTGLRQDTLNFTQLEKGMKVEFTPKIFEGNKHRAIKIKVLEDERSENQDIEHGS